MRQELFLGINQSTNSSQGVLINPLGDEQQTIAQLSIAVPEPVRAECAVNQDPLAILNSVIDLLEWGRARSQELGIPIRAWGLSVQDSGVLAWSKETGEILHPLITAQDRTMQPYIDGLGAGCEKISNLTGLPTLVNFAATKIHRLQRAFLNSSTYVATLDSYLVNRLSEGKIFSTEDSMAALTMLYTLERGDDSGWSEWLCRRFEVDVARLPEIAPSLKHHFTYNDLPLMALIGERQALMLGGLVAESRQLLTLGSEATSLSLSCGVAVLRKPGLISSVLYSRRVSGVMRREVRYLIEALASSAKGLLAEVIERGWAADYADIESLCREAYAANPTGLATAYWVDNSFSSPDLPPGVSRVMAARNGALVRDRVRAVVESIGNIVVRMLEQFAEKGLLGERYPAQIDLVGSVSSISYLSQYVADVSGHVVSCLGASDYLSARGAAFAAWHSVYPASEVSRVVTSSRDRCEEYRCIEPERRRRYLAWVRLEQDLLRGSLPEWVEVV
jgi:glycerol kinase